MLFIQDNWNDSGFACCAKAAPRLIQEDDASAVAMAAPAFNTRRRVGSTLNSITALRSGMAYRRTGMEFASGVPHHSTNASKCKDFEISSGRSWHDLLHACGPPLEGAA